MKAAQRGEMVDVGGRRLRIVRAGAPSVRPTILLESGSFGCAADWDEVQQRLTALGLRSLAYDRAGLGLSDPGPKPRDCDAIVRDLEAALAAAGEDGPYLLAGHSMAGLMVHLFARRHPQQVVGVVLVDATTAESIDDPMVARAVQAYRRAVRAVGWASHLGIMTPAALVVGDMIGLSGAAQAEKRRIYGSGAHARWSAEEVQHWPASARQCIAAGALPPELPVAVVTAGAETRARAMKALQVVPAEASRRPYVEHVAGANHASLLGARYADAIVRGIEHVLAATAAEREPEADRRII